MDRAGASLPIEVRELYEEFTFPLRGNHGNYMERYVFPHAPGYPQKILDAGCGTGNLAVELAKHFPSAQIVGMDFSENSLAEARASAKRQNIANIDFRYQDLMKECHLDARESLYDFAISIGCLHHTPDPGLGLRNLRKVIKKEGLLIIAVYGKYGRIETELRRDLMNLFRQVTGNSNKDLMRLCKHMISEPVFVQNGIRTRGLTMAFASLLVCKEPFRFAVMMAKSLFSKMGMGRRVTAAPLEIGMADQYLHPLVQNWTATQWVDTIESNGFAVDHFVYDSHPRGQCISENPLEKIRSSEIRDILSSMTPSEQYEAYNLIFRPPMNIMACKAV